jgi:hypothetical protein
MTKCGRANHGASLGNSSSYPSRESEMIAGQWVHVTRPPCIAFGILLALGARNRKRWACGNTIRGVDP